MIFNIILFLSVVLLLILEMGLDYGCGTNFFSPLVTLLAVAAALIVPYLHDNIRKKNEAKTDLKIIGGKTIWQGENNKVKFFRLLIENKGEAVAEDVEPYLFRIKTPEGNERGGFVPMPLEWMHVFKLQRDILPHQVVYLDLFRLRPEKDGLLVCDIASSVGINHGKNLCQINYEDDARLEIILYQRNGKVMHCALDYGKELWTKEIISSGELNLVEL